MAPEIVAEAIRAYTDETNRLNHERRASSAADKAELAKIAKEAKAIVTAIGEGRSNRILMDRLDELEAMEDAIRARMAEAPLDTPEELWGARHTINGGRLFASGSL